MRSQIRTVLVCLVLPAVVVFAASCMEKTIRVGVPAATPAPPPPLRVEPKIRLEDFRKICNFLPEEGDRMNETESDDAGKTVQLTLGTTKRRQNPVAVRNGCTPGATFVFSGPELRLQ